MAKKIWKIDDIFVSPQPQDTPIPRRHEIEFERFRFTDEFLSGCSSETEWVSDPIPGIDPATQEAIGLAKISCTVCGGSGSVSRQKHGAETGILFAISYICSCRSLGSFWRIWDHVPLRWRGVTLEGLEPYTQSPMDMGRQVTVLETVKANPTVSYHFYGDPGTGKTHYAYALYRKALATWAASPKAAEGVSVWYLSTAALLDQAAEHAVDKSYPAPAISREIIHKRRRQGLRPCLILSEVDKAGLTTDFRRRTLIELVDAVWEEEGQVVMTSNATPQELADEWGGKYADALLRRFAAAPNGYALNFSRSPKKSVLTTTREESVSNV